MSTIWDSSAGSTVKRSGTADTPGNLIFSSSPANLLWYFEEAPWFPTSSLCSLFPCWFISDVTSSWESLLTPLMGILVMDPLSQCSSVGALGFGTTLVSPHLKRMLLEYVLCVIFVVDPLAFSLGSGIPEVCGIHWQPIWLKCLYPILARRNQGTLSQRVRSERDLGEGRKKCPK